MNKYQNRWFNNQLVSILKSQPNQQPFQFNIFPTNKTRSWTLSNLQFNSMDLLHSTSSLSLLLFLSLQCQNHIPLLLLPRPTVNLRCHTKIPLPPLNLNPGRLTVHATLGASASPTGEPTGVSSTTPPLLGMISGPASPLF